MICNLLKASFFTTLLSLKLARVLPNLSVSNLLTFDFKLARSTFSFNFNLPIPIVSFLNQVLLQIFFIYLTIIWIIITFLLNIYFITFFLDYFFNTKLCLIYLLQFFFVNCSNNFLTTTIFYYIWVFLIFLITKNSFDQIGV